MGATYTRQSSYSDGDVITAAHTNDEFNQLLAAFAASTGHTHDGTAGEGGPVTTLFSNTLSFGDGSTDSDITITFNANGNDGVFKWMEDEDYFEFSDDILVASTEKLQFRDTALYINSSTDGQLDIVADTEVQIAATTVDINGAVDVSGTLTVGGNIVIGSADISEAELEVLDGLTVTTAEVNILDGDTTASSTTLADADRVVVNDAGTMKQVALTDFETYFESALDTLSNVTTVGALNSGSITSGFGNIDTGSSTITTTGLITGGSLDIDDVLINGSTIGHTDDTDLITLANGIATVAGEISVTTLDIGGTNITATAAELNLTDGGSSIGTTAVSDGHGILMNHGGTMAQTTVQTLAAYLDDEITAMPNLVTTAATTVGALNSGSITSGFGAIDNGSSAITTTGTITGGAVTADDVSIDGKVITMTGSTSDTAVFTAGTNGTLDITTTDDAGTDANIQITADGTAELAGTTVTLDSSGGITLDADGGTITFADGGASLGTITSSGYSGNAATATTASVATTVTITDNESTNEDNAIIFGAGGDVDGGNLGLESDGDFTYNPSTGILKVGRVDIGSGTVNLNIESTNTGATDGPQIDIYRNSSSPADDDDIGQIRFSGNNSADEKILYASIFAEIDDVTDGTENGAIIFNLEDDGSLQRMVEFGTTEAVFNTNGLAGIDFRVESNSETHMLFVDAGNNQVNVGTSLDYGGKLNIKTSDNTDNLVLVSTDSDENLGPILNMRRDSSSPADDDVLGAITFEGDDSGGNVNTYAMIQTKASDVTNGSEDGMLQFIVDKDGTLISGLNVGSSEAVFNEDSAAVNLRVESNGDANMLFVDGTNDRVGIARNDPAVTFDVTGTGRFSAGVLFGTDTAAVNTLDDYEEGTFTPSFNFASANASAGSTVGNGRYVKIGSLVTVYVRANNINVSGASGDLQIGNLPFTSLVDTGDGTVVTYVGSARVNHINFASNSSIAADIPDNSLFLRIVENIDNAGADVINATNCSDGQTDVFACVTYPTAS